MTNSLELQASFSCFISFSQSWFSIKLTLTFIAGSFKSQLIDYFRGAITSWELVEGSLWQFYDNET